MRITYAHGGRGTVAVEPGRKGGRVVVVRRGFPVAAEVVGAFPLGHGHDVAHTLALLGVADAASVAAEVEA